MTEWFNRNRSNFSSDLGPLQLAWLGDAVWELHQRLRYCQKPAKGKFLHLSVVKEVKAKAQADALNYLNPYLTDFEKDYVRKGRNKAGQGPRKGEEAIYGKATGFETIIGWLFLNNPDRLSELFKQLEKFKPD